MPLTCGPGFTLPDSIVTETIAMLAKRGGGKSNAGVVMAEQMWHAGHQWCAIDPKGDWYGIRTSRSGKGVGLPIPVFGGRHGDIPLEATAGELMARIVVEQNVTCVLDVSLFSKGDQIRFVTDFAETLFRLLGGAPRPIMLFLEEAEEFLPQRVDARAARMVGAYSKISKQGRTIGLGVTLITQRSASLNKDALSQTDTLVLFRTTSPHDRKAVVAWAEHHDEAKEVAATLAQLEPGESWILSPGFLGSIQRVRWARRETFDSGATPVAGRKAATPTAVADIDLDAIRVLMAETVERAAAVDPKALRARIVALEQERDALARMEVKSHEVIREVVRDVVPAEMPEWLRELNDGMETARDAFVETVNAALEQFARRAGAHVSTPTVTEHRPDPAAARPSPAARPPAPARPTTSAVGQAPQIKAGARRILETLAAVHPTRVTKPQLGSLAKFKITGGTFGTYWSTLRRAGFVDEDGDLLTISQAGMDFIGYTPAAPMTRDERLEMWRGVLKAGARDMLNVVVERYPLAVTKDYLATACNMTASGGTFGTYLSTLKRNGLVDVDGPEVRATDQIMSRP